MKITVKMQDDLVVICSKCHWSGAIQDAHWMNEFVEYGYCPTCGGKEFDDIDTWEQEEVKDKWTFERIYDGWKARAFVYLLLAGILVFGIVPWIWGWCSFFKWIF